MRLSVPPATRVFTAAGGSFVDKRNGTQVAGDVVYT